MARASKKEEDAAVSRKMISVLAADLSEPDGQVRGLFKRSQEVRYARVNIPAEDLSSRLKEFFETIHSALNEIPSEVGGLSLDTIALAVEISAKGTVSLLGTGGEIAAKGGMTFTLKRGHPKGD
jgi:hypothetical protein